MSTESTPLARWPRTRLATLLEHQGHLLRPVLAKARELGRTDVAALWAGQGASLLRDRRAADLYAALVDGTHQLLADDGLELARGGSDV